MGRSIVNGWTVVTPSGTYQDGFRTGAPSTTTTMILYVSSATGKNSGDSGFNAAIQGSLAQPYRTVGAALAQAGSQWSGRGATYPTAPPDWILFANGEVWVGADADFDPINNGGLFTSGLSPTQPLVFASYDKSAANNPPIPNPGTGGARPLFKTPSGKNAICQFYHNVCILGLEFRCYTRDPNDTAYSTTPQLTHGMFAADHANDCLVEDCSIGYYQDCYNPQIATFANSPTDSGNNVWARRNIMHHAYDDTGNVSKGIGSWGMVTNHLIEENLFDTDGWLPQIGNPGSSLQHNLYLSAGSHNGGYSDLHYKGNICSNDAFSSQIRCGGEVYNNLFFVGAATGLNYGMPPSTPTAHRIDSNIFMGNAVASTTIEINAQSPDTEGDVWAGGPVTLVNCLFLQSTSASNCISIGSAGAYNGLLTATNNIAWRFAPVIVYTGSDTYTLTGYNTATSTNTFGWPFPDRTPATYMHEIIDGAGIGAGAGTRTYQDYINACYLQRKGAWNPLLMAESVNDYIRQGFNLTMIGSAYAGFSPGTPPVLMAQICM